MCAVSYVVMAVWWLAVVTFPVIDELFQLVRPLDIGQVALVLAQRCISRQIGPAPAAAPTPATVATAHLACQNAYLAWCCWWMSDRTSVTAMRYQSATAYRIVDSSCPSHVQRDAVRVTVTAVVGLSDSQQRLN